MWRRGRLDRISGLVRWLTTEDAGGRIPRFKELGVISTIQALWAYPDTYIVDLTQPKIGPERSEWLHPTAPAHEGEGLPEPTEP